MALRVRLEPELRERHFGCCEGKTREEILAGDAAVAQALAARSVEYVLPGGESLRQRAYLTASPRACPVWRAGMRGRSSPSSRTAECSTWFTATCMACRWNGSAIFHCRTRRSTGWSFSATTGGSNRGATRRTRRHGPGTVRDADIGRNPERSEEAACYDSLLSMACEADDVFSERHPGKS